MRTVITERCNTTKVYDFRSGLEDVCPDGERESELGRTLLWSLEEVRHHRHRHHA
jgi:hypothetical protein